MNNLIPLKDVRALLGTNNRPSLPTIWRWCVKGIQGHRLEAFRIGRLWYTTEAAVLEFGRVLAETTIANLESKQLPRERPFPPPKKRSAKQREREIAAAEQYLRDEGILK